MLARALLLTSLALTAVPALAQQSAADEALQRVSDSREQRASEQVERMEALHDRVRSSAGADEGDRGTGSGSVFARQERVGRSLARQAERDTPPPAQPLETWLIPQGEPLGPKRPPPR